MHLTLKRVGWQPTVKENDVSVEKKRKLVWNLKKASWKRKRIYNNKQPIFLAVPCEVSGGGNTSSKGAFSS